MCGNKKVEPQKLSIGMFGRRSSPWHLVCPELLSATSTKKSTQKLKSSDHPWRRVWVKSGSVPGTQSQGPESGLCYEGWEEGPVLERAYPADLEVMAPSALPQTSHMCFRHILHFSLAAGVKWRCCLTLPHQGAVKDGLFPICRGSHGCSCK